MEASDEETILYLTFNNDGSCFCVGTTKGYRIYKSYPLKCLAKKDIEGGISIIDMLNRSNILAFVGTGKNENKSNKVIIWDSIKSEAINEIVSMYDIKNIKLKRTKLFIITEKNITVFSQGNWEKLETIKTYENKNGIFGISLDPKLNIIAYPSQDIGKIIIKNFDEKKDDKCITKEINAHQTEVTALVMNNDASLLASASMKGTIIKIFKTKDSSLIQELRRGTEPANIYSLAFDYSSEYLACSSNKGTVHIFNVKNDDNNEVHNQKSIFGNVISFFGIQNEYLNSEWSFAQLRLTFNGKSIVSFSTDSSTSIIVIVSDGQYFQGEMDKKTGGQCQTSLKQNFLTLDIEKEEN